jgi:hypothetical protein
VYSLNTELRLVDFPYKWISKDDRIEYEIKMLEIDGKCEVLANLVEFMKNDQTDFSKLMNTLKMQLKSESILQSGTRLRHYKKNYQVLEYKSPKGHGRIFGFVSRESRRMIICTNSYWKNSGKKKNQTRAFEKADRLRSLYLSRNLG